MYPKEKKMTVIYCQNFLSLLLPSRLFCKPDPYFQRSALKSYKTHSDEAGMTLRSNTARVLLFLQVTSHRRRSPRCTWPSFLAVAGEGEVAWVLVLPYAHCSY